MTSDLTPEKICPERAQESYTRLYRLLLDQGVNLRSMSLDTEGFNPRIVLGKIDIPTAETWCAVLDPEPKAGQGQPEGPGAVSTGGSGTESNP
ncbi:hypothetical protein [Streptomyces jumonjinensis]